MTATSTSTHLGHGEETADPISLISQRPPLTGTAEPDVATAAPAKAEADASTPDPTPVPKVRGVVVIATLAGVSFLNTMGSGILIAATPQIARDVGLSQSLILWPAAVYALAAGCLLLIFGAVADVVGAKPMWVAGSFLFAIFTVALGFARTGVQVIVIRTLLGVAISMCLPTAPPPSA